MISLVCLASFLALWLHNSYKEAKSNLTTNIAFQVVRKSSQLKDSIIIRYMNHLDIDDKNLDMANLEAVDKKISDMLGDTSLIQHPRRTKFNTDSLEIMSYWQINDTINGLKNERTLQLVKNLDTMVEQHDMSLFLTSQESFPRQKLADLNVSRWDILRKIKLNILISMLLFAMVSFTFYLMHRNLANQKKLTLLKNDFISNMTHELKTPLSTVSVALEAMSNFDALEDKSKTAEYISISQSEVSRLSLLVDKVLSFQKMESGLDQMKKDEIVIQKLIEHVISSMRLQFEKHGAILESDIPAKEIILKGDGIHLTNVLYNLIDNALKYSSRQPLIKIGLREQTDKIILQISDNGIGIPAAYLSGIFDRFFRVPQGNKHEIKGYGLGLHYVKQVLLLHGGDIVVESTEQEGSCFTITLPING